MLVFSHGLIDIMSQDLIFGDLMTSVVSSTRSKMGVADRDSVTQTAINPVAPQSGGVESLMLTANVRDAKTSEGVAHLKKILNTMIQTSIMETAVPSNLLRKIAEHTACLIMELPSTFRGFPASRLVGARHLILAGHILAVPRLGRSHVI